MLLGWANLHIGSVSAYATNRNCVSQGPCLATATLLQRCCNKMWEELTLEGTFDFKEIQ